jgi:hypothetical protein
VKEGEALVENGQADELKNLESKCFSLLSHVTQLCRTFQLLCMWILLVCACFCVESNNDCVCPMKAVPFSMHKWDLFNTNPFKACPWQKSRCHLNTPNGH